MREIILPYRKCGNTTRQVDEWVQQLFQSGSILVVDHAHRDGNAANQHAERVLFRRLSSEHGLEVGVNLDWDYKSRKLTLSK